jgi:serine/threonine protein kinase
MSGGLPKLKDGTILEGRYRIVSELGRGGFGAVYQARDLSLNRICAIKENLETSEEAQRQFTREAMVLASLIHRNLPRVTDHFIVPGQGQYLVMDFIDGEDLESLMEQGGPVEPDKAIAWISQIADALNYLHSQRPPVIHRDVKPANIRLTPLGDVFLVDFGLVKQSQPHQKTTVGARAVTPGFSPPEQYGTGITDERSDIYSLGATLYTLLTATEPPESVQRVGKDTLAPIQQTNPQVSASVGQAIARSMALQPDQRYHSAAEFNSMLTSQVAATVVQPTASKPGTRPIWPYVGILVVLAICLFSVGLLWPKFGPYIVAVVNPTDTPIPTLTRPPSTKPPPSPTNTPTLFTETTNPTVTMDATPSDLTPTPSQTPITTYTPTPAILPTYTQLPLPSGNYDLAFASDRTGQFRSYLIDSDQRDDWIELPLPGGYNRAWWPWFCGSQIAVEVQDRSGSNPQWIYLINSGSGTIKRWEPSIDLQALGVPRCPSNPGIIAYPAKLEGSWGWLVVDNYPVRSSAPLHREQSWGYSSWPMDGTTHYSMNREDGQWVLYRATNIMTGAEDRSLIIKGGKYPAISPDGEDLVYVCHDTEDLCIQHIPSGVTRILTNLTYVPINDEKMPASAMWSLDGDWIYFASADDGDWDIFRIRPDGSGLQNLTSNWDSNELMPALQW